MNVEYIRIAAIVITCLFFAALIVSLVCAVEICIDRRNKRKASYEQWWKKTGKEQYKLLQRVCKK